MLGPATAGAARGQAARTEGSTSARRGTQDVRHLSAATEPYQVDVLETGARCSRSTVRTPSCSMGLGCVPRSTARPSSAGSGSARTPRSSIPPVSRSACAARRRPGGDAPRARRRRERADHRSCVRLEGPWGHARAKKVVLVNQRLPTARERDPPHCRARLRLRARDRAAVAGAARGRSAGSAGRASPTRRTASTTRASRPTTAPLVGVRRDLPLPVVGRPGARGPRRRRSTCSLASCSRRSPSSKGSVAPTGWSASSTRPPASPCASARATAARSAYVVGYTGLGVVASRFGARGRARPPRRARLRPRAGSTSCAGARSPTSRAAAVARMSTRPGRALAGPTAARGWRGPWLRLLDRFGVGFDS